MKRREDWPERLADYLDAQRDVAFDWASHSCAAFAAGAVEAMSGEAVDIPAHGSAREAAGLLAARGLRERIGDMFGPEIVPALAQRGDLVLVDIAGCESVAVCIGTEAAGPGDAGLLTVPMRLAVAAWRV
jgi:hypothetical protein